MRRRRALGLIGASLGGVAGAGLLGRYRFLPPGRSASLDTVKNLSISLYESMDASIRGQACVDYDHPLRQYHNRGVRGGGLAIDAGTFNRDQRIMLTDLLHAGLSAQGRERIPREFFTSWLGVHAMKVLICGDPRAPFYQLILSGPHLNLRLGGRNREDVAFGGPMVYGDQRGNNAPGLPGNLYRYQFQIASRLLQSLAPRERGLAVIAKAPIQTQIELQGSRGSFAGAPVATLSPASKAIVRELIDGILSTYPPEDVEYAAACLADNGGVNSLFLSYYEDGDPAGRGEPQIFRLEGPAAVLYFRGFPHVHAFVNIGKDGDDPLSVGREIGHNPLALEGAAVKRLFETAMKGQTGADFAYYGPDSVVGKLRKGVIRTGDIYNLESWQDSIILVEIKGSNLRGPCLDQLREGGLSPSGDVTYAIATAGYVGDDPAFETLGRIKTRREGAMLRDAIISHLETRGFPAEAQEAVPVQG